MDSFMIHFTDLQGYEKVSGVNFCGTSLWFPWRVDITVNKENKRIAKKKKGKGV